MEVMLEIYKSLNELGMEWKKKKGIDWPEIGVRPSGSTYSVEVEQILEDFAEEYDVDYRMGKPRPDKKTESAEEKLAQNLFVVETRHRYGNVMVGPFLLHGDRQ